MTVSLARARKTARRLLRENRKRGRSWRVIAREDFNNKINITTLCRFAITKGEWYPKDEGLQIILGFRTPRKPRPKQKTVNEMTKHELLTHITQRVEKMNLVLLRRGMGVRVKIARDA